MKAIECVHEDLHHPCGAFWKLVDISLFLTVVMSGYLYITVFYYKFIFFLYIIVSYTIILFKIYLTGSL